LRSQPLIAVPRIARRSALLTGAAGSALSLLGCARSELFEPEAEPAVVDAGHPLALFEVPEDRGFFPLGVQVGSMRDDLAVFWTFGARSVPLELSVFAERESPAALELLGTLALPPGPDGFVHVRVQGLVPGAWHRYAFRSGDRRSSFGRFRAAPPTDFRGSLLLGATSCTSRTLAPYHTLIALAREPLDMFLQVGDMSYNDGARLLTDFRPLWFQTLADPGYQAVLGATGAYFIWDDHEVLNDFDPEALALNDPTLIPTAKQAYLETLPIEQNELGGLWHSYRWGQTAELFVLDCRSERIPSSALTPQATYISREQMSWLKGALAASKAHFKVIVNSVPIARYPSAPVWGPPTDRWEGYAAQREELLEFIAAQPIEHVLFVSGDFHLGLVQQVDVAGRDAGLWEVVTGPGAQVARDPSTLASPQIVQSFAESTCTTFELDPAKNAVRVRFLNGDGQVLLDRWLSV
jgi:alkaline phosphatase D